MGMYKNKLGYVKWQGVSQSQRVKELLSLPYYSFLKKENGKVFLTLHGNNGIDMVITINKQGKREAVKS